MEEKIINFYARWIIEKCDTPIDEIEWIVHEVLASKSNGSYSLQQVMQDVYDEYKN